MNASEKLEQLAQFAKTGEVFEYEHFIGSIYRAQIKVDASGKYGVFLKSSNGIDFEDSDMKIVNVLQNIREIRAIPKLPQLTQEEKDFLKWFPQDWWMARSEKGRIYIYDHKPHKNADEGDWYAEGNWEDIPRIISLTFTEIKWSDEDCFTIGELRK